MKIDLQTDTDYGARRKRRDAVKVILAQLTAIRCAEQRHLDNVPENFQCSESFEIGEHAVDSLGEIIDLLSDIY